MTADVIVKAVAPDAKAVQGLIRVARERSRIASLSVSSTTKMVLEMVANATNSAYGSAANEWDALYAGQISSREF